MSNKPANQIFEYKGYIGSIEADVVCSCLHGKILYINDLISYEAETIPELKKQFEESVDDYIQTCKELGREPQKSFSGTFNVRPGPELHRAAVIEMQKRGMGSLNEFVKYAINTVINHNDINIHHHIHHHEMSLTQKLDILHEEPEVVWTVDQRISNAQH